MPSTPDFAAAAQTQVDVLVALSTTAFQGAEKIAALNLKVAKAGLADAAEASRALLSAKDAQAVLAVQTRVVQPSAVKAGEYASEVAAIMSETKAELDKVLATTVADVKGAYASLVDAAMKSAPAGSADAIAMWKSALAGATNGYEALQNAAKQATEAAQANYAAVSGSVAKAAKARR